MKTGRRETKPHRRKRGPQRKSAPGAGIKSVMVLVYMTPDERALLDEICYYIRRNSHGHFRPSRTEIIRRLVRRLRAAKKALKKVGSVEQLDKAFRIL